MNFDGLGHIIEKEVWWWLFIFWLIAADSDLMSGICCRQASETTLPRCTVFGAAGSARTPICSHEEYKLNCGAQQPCTTRTMAQVNTNHRSSTSLAQITKQFP